jgi:hypothetical protein
VEGEAQNKFEKAPIIMGDAKGGRTSQLIAADELFLESVRERLGIPLRVIVHLRNPFDMLSTRAYRKGRSTKLMVDRFAPKLKAVETAWNRLHEDERLLQRHEDVIADPSLHIKRMFEFLEVEPIPSVIDACARRIWQKPHTRRKEVEWAPAATHELNELLAESQLFSSYVE